MGKDYSQNKNYLIKSPNTDKVYVGSTTLKYLSQRLAFHVQDARPKSKKYCSSKKILECGDYYIELIENFPCSNIAEQRKREGYWQDVYKDVIVNERKAGRTQKEYNSFYRNENRDYCNELTRKHYQANKDAIKKKASEKQKNAKRIHCECTGCYSTQNNYKIQRHMQSKMHKEFVENINFINNFNFLSTDIPF